MSRSAIVLGAAAALLLAARVAPATAEPVADAGAHRHTVIALTAFGNSFALGERRVKNLAPPSAEVRLGLRPRRARWAVAEAGLGLIVFPEAVPTLTLGLRVHPLVDVPYARTVFVRLGGLGLVAVDGFDLAVGGEVGVAATRQRVVGWLGLGADRFVRESRLVVQAKAGVGLTF